VEGTSPEQIIEAEQVQSPQKIRLELVVTEIGADSPNKISLQ